MVDIANNIGLDWVEWVVRKFALDLIYRQTREGNRCNISLSIRKRRRLACLANAFSREMQVSNIDFNRSSNYTVLGRFPTNGKSFKVLVKC